MAYRFRPAQASTQQLGGTRNSSREHYILTSLLGNNIVHVIQDNNDLMPGQPYLCPSAKPYLVSTINKQPCSEIFQVGSYMLNEV